MWEKILMMVLPALVGAITPTIRDFLIDALKHMEAAAANTDNPIDDVFVNLLRLLLNVPD